MRRPSMHAAGCCECCSYGMRVCIGGYYEPGIDYGGVAYVDVFSWGDARCACSCRCRMVDAARQHLTHCVWRLLSAAWGPATGATSPPGSSQRTWQAENRR